jgi:signal transduction histidine kinase
VNVNILSLPAILALSINVSVALSVLAARPKELAHRLISGFVLSFAVWNLGEIILVNASTAGTARLGAHLIDLGFFLSPALFLLVALNWAPRTNTPFARWPAGLATVAAPLILLLLRMPEPVMSTMRVRELGNIYFHSLASPRPRVLYALLVLDGGYLALGVSNLVRRYHRARFRRERIQSALLVVGFAGIEALAVGANVVRSVVPRKDFFFLATALSIAISGFFALAIWRYHLVSLHRLLHRGLVYSALSALVLSFYFLLIRHAVFALESGFGLRSAAPQALIILALIILVKPVEDNINRGIERLSSSSRKRLRSQIGELRDELIRYSSVSEFLNHLEDSLRSITGASRVGIFVLEPGGDGWLARIDGQGTQPGWLANGPVLDRIAEDREVLELSELAADAPDDPLARALIDAGFREIVPLQATGVLAGFVALGPKTDGRDYALEELEALPMFADEITGALSRTLALQESRAQAARLEQAERLATMGRMVAGIAHEIRNPLNVMSTAAQTLQERKLSESERMELARFVEDETEHLSVILNDFLRLARPRTPESVPGRVQYLLDSVARAVASAADERGVRTVLATVEGKGRMSTDFRMLEQILINLALNAIGAMSGGGTLTLRAGLGVPGWLTLEVEDTGGGIPMDLHARISEPFFTTKEDGTGLGLPIAHSLVDALGGHLRFRTGPEGTTFEVEIPIGEGGGNWPQSPRS